jgi:hypothetical protein
MKKLKFLISTVCILLFFNAHQSSAQSPSPTLLTVRVVDNNNSPMLNKPVGCIAQTMGTVMYYVGHTNANGQHTFEITFSGTANVVVWTEECTGDTLVAYLTLTQNQAQTVTLVFCDSSIDCNPVFTGPHFALVNAPTLFEFINVTEVFNCLVTAGPGPVSIGWSINNQMVAGADSILFQHTFTWPGTYTVCLHVNTPTFPGYTACKNITILADTTDCNLNTDFVYNINNTAAAFYALGDTVNNSFIWEVNNVIITGSTILYYDFQSPGQYIVCLTEYRDSICSKTVCKTITIQGGQQGLNIFGKVLANGTCPPDNVSLQLIGIYNNAYYETNQWTVGTDSCMYIFGGNISPAAYLLRAVPSGITATAYLPTYYGNTTNWIASTFVPNLTLPVLPYNIELVPFGFDSTYLESGFVNGYIAGTGGTVYTILNGDTIYTTFTTSNAIVIIYNSQGQPVAYTTLNPDGIFSFPSLPYGNYTLQVQHPLVNHAPVAFSLTAAEPGRWIQGLVNNSGVSTIVNLQNKAQKLNIQVYPNPAVDKVHIKGSKLQSVQLLDMSGRIINATFDGECLHIQHVCSGVYWLKVKDSSGQTHTHKLIKQ